MIQPVSNNTYRPGYVRSANGPTRITQGQVWRVTNGGGSVSARIEGIEDGAVYLRPHDEGAFRAVFTRQEANKQGQPVDVLAFKEMGGFKKGAPDEWKNGTFAAHEAWDVWLKMSLEP